MKTLLITGATGFVGLKLVEELKDKYNLVLIVRNTRKATSLIGMHKNIRLISIDQPDYANSIKESNAEILIHLATFLSSKERSEININNFIESNVLFGTKVLNSCVGSNLKYFVNFGTCLEYRNNSKELQSSDLYSASKSAFRTIIKYYQDIMDFNWINIIPFSIYGLGSPKIVLDYIFDSLESREPINFTEGNQVIEYSVKIEPCVSLELCQSFR